jgi:TDG/mug DNA glycosylase family protein
VRQPLARGLGFPHGVARAPTAAAELAPEEFERGGRLLRAKVKRYRPRFLAVLGVGAYRAAFARPQAGIGRQAEKLEAATVWVLPNPSGLNANYRTADLARLFRELRDAVEREL